MRSPSYGPEPEDFSVEASLFSSSTSATGKQWWLECQFTGASLTVKFLANHFVFPFHESDWCHWVNRRGQRLSESYQSNYVWKRSISLVCEELDLERVGACLREVDDFRLHCCIAGSSIASEWGVSLMNLFEECKELWWHCIRWSSL